jgi:adenylate cyclase
MQTDCGTKRNDRSNATEATNHTARLVSGSIKVNRSRDGSCLRFSRFESGVYGFRYHFVIQRDGFSEELLDALAKVPGLRVVARTSAFSFKGKNVPVSEIATKLGVANIIEGSLRRDGKRIRVTTQLISARDGFQLWSNTFQRELQDVFAVQDEMTHAIVDALKVKLVGATSVRTGTENADAYDLYLQGLYFSNKSGEQDLRKSLTLFQQALDKDPNFSRAWTGIAKAWLYLADAYVRPLEAYPVVVSAASNALQLNELDPEAHCFLGVAKRVLEWDPERMLKETQRALEIDPNSSLGHVWLGDTLRDRGEFDRALSKYQKAVGLDPLSPIVSDALCYGYVNAGRLDDAIAQGKHTLELDPNYVYLDSNLANAYRERGLLDQAIVVYRAGEQSTHSPSAGLAITYARLGKIKEAEQKLSELLAQKDRQYISASNIALVYAALGKKDEAFAWLERAYSEHDAEVTIIAFYPGTQSLRRDPRFIDLVKRVGLDPAKAIPSEGQH